MEIHEICLSLLFINPVACHMAGHFRFLSSLQLAPKTHVYYPGTAAPARAVSELNPQSQQATLPLRHFAHAQHLVVSCSHLPQTSSHMAFF